MALTLGALPLAFKFLNLSSKVSFSRTECFGTSLSATPASISMAVPAQSNHRVYCGRGDKKTAKGKRFKHSFGNARPRNKKKGRGPPRVPAPSSPIKKDRFDDDNIVKIEIDESLFSN